MNKCIHIEGARQHNLKNITIDIPREKLVVICGPSGSGKSTLAFDIVYAEGQRRYVESLSTYARQFLPQMDKPDIDKIEGLSPAISLEQQTTGRNPRSTVGTTTEIYDFLRVFYARLGKMYCTGCSKPIEARSVDEIIADILALPEGTKIILLSPLVELQKGTHIEKLKKLKADGFVRVRIDGILYTIDEAPSLDKNKKHTIELVVDRLIIKNDIRGRLADSVELALRYGGGRVIIHEISISDEKKGIDTIHATESVCTSCRISFPTLTPQLFSFNSPQGACPRCSGLGTIEYFEPLLIAPNRGLSLNTKAILPWANPKIFHRYESSLKELGRKYGFNLSTPLSEFNAEALDILFYGEQINNTPSQLSKSKKTVQKTIDNQRWSGIIPILEQSLQYGDMWRDILSRYLQNMDCPVCHGARLRTEALAVQIQGVSIQELCTIPVSKTLNWLQQVIFSGRHAIIAEPLLKELIHRLKFMINVGLDYLSLGRTMTTLSGGEAQRIRLASQLGSGLVGVTYVLDEPSIGLHPRDNERLVSTLRSLQKRGNTVLVVEHDEATIRESDMIIELGPGSGLHGGEKVFQGSFRQLINESNTLTAKYMRGDLTIPIPDKRRQPENYLTLQGITTHNLKNITCSFPLGTLTCVTGVSGSGKSSLVVDTLYKHLALAHSIRVDQPGIIHGIQGIENVERTISIDQTPIGKTPRSNPATYTKIFDEIRNIFAMTPDAKKRGYQPGRFSFNVPGGRCETCKGDGQLRVEMHFLPDIYVTCDICNGKRYNHETLEVRYRGLNISEVLGLAVHEARKFFTNYPILERKLAILEEVGLDYLQLGQPATTLSGGEAQRIKISRELGKRSLPGTLYILDEPTTGLHMHEVGKLITVLQQLVDKKATVVVIEHNKDVILASDFVIDLGPGGGENGGHIVASGTPEEIMQDPQSITGKFLLEEVNVQRSYHTINGITL